MRFFLKYPDAEWREVDEQEYIAADFRLAVDRRVVGVPRQFSDLPNGIQDLLFQRSPFQPSTPVLTETEEPVPDVVARMQASIDAFTEVVTKAVSTITDALERQATSDRLDPPPPPSLDQTVAEVSRRLGAAILPALEWMGQHSELIRFAAEVDNWRTIAVAIGADTVDVDNLVKEAVQYATEHGTDPMYVARTRWQQTYDRLTSGEASSPGWGLA